MDAERIRLVIASPHNLLREGLREILLKEKSIEIIAETIDGPQTLEVIRELKPSILLLDISIIGVNGLRTISLMKSECPATRALMLSGGLDEESVFSALKAGIKGYVCSEANSKELIKAIQAVHRGELWVQRKVISKFLDGEYSMDSREKESRRSYLTEREREVLGCLTAGSSNKEIAEKLFISEKTVKTHLNSIFRKLRVTKRLQAILYALDRNMH